MGPSLVSFQFIGEIRGCLCFPMCCEFFESRELVLIVMVTRLPSTGSQTLYTCQKYMFSQLVLWIC